MKRGITQNEVIKEIHRHAGFLKHANRNEQKISFSETHLLSVLGIACNDYGNLFDMSPIEIQVFETWQYACFLTKVSNASLRMQEFLRECLKAFPGVRDKKSVDQQREIGREVLEKSLASGLFAISKKFDIYS
jgi:hypothetical protein